MDWVDFFVVMVLWVFFKGMKCDGMVGDNLIKWSVKYGLIIVFFYDVGIVDGMNEKGFVVNMLYLKEVKWGDVIKVGKFILIVGVWV